MSGASTQIAISTHSTRDLAPSDLQQHDWDLRHSASQVPQLSVRDLDLHCFRAAIHPSRQMDTRHGYWIITAHERRFGSRSRHCHKSEVWITNAPKASLFEPTHPPDTWSRNVLWALCATRRIFRARICQNALSLSVAVRDDWGHPHT